MQESRMNLKDPKFHREDSKGASINPSPNIRETSRIMDNIVTLESGDARVLYDTFISIAANSRYAIPVNFVALKHAEWNKGRRVQKGTFLNRHSTNFPTTRGTFQSSPRP